MTETASGAPSPETYQKDFINILLADVFAAMERRDASDSQSDRRDLIRTTFAAIEGMVWAYREHVTMVARNLEEIALNEEAALSEVTYHVTEQGKISEQKRYLSLPATFRLTTRLATKVTPDLDVRFDDTGWNQFRQTIEIRNRITHPKSEHDLSIDDQDISTGLTAFFWIFNVTLTVMETATTALREHLHEFQQILGLLKRGDPTTLSAYKAVIRKATE